MTLSVTFVAAIILLILPSAFGIFGGSSKVKTLKSDILTLAKKVNRGASETAEDRAAMKKLFEALEKQNKYKNSLKSPLINAVWNLEYTTSDTILGRGGSPRVGPILQTIDANRAFAKNSETVQYFGFLPVQRSVDAEIKPMSPSKVAVQFKKFKIGPVSFNCPPSFKGELDITYVDEDLRLSRGDKGNIFVLTKLKDL
jgi:PAP_fibrillin